MFYPDRTMAVSATMISGRVGAIVGNLLFPILLSAGCLGPFIMIGSACFGKSEIFTSINCEIFSLTNYSDLFYFSTWLIVFQFVSF